MASSKYRSSYGSISFGGPMTRAAKMLVIICCVAFVLQIIDRLSGGPAFTAKFGLTPAAVTGSYHLWQVVTYIFLHGGFFHLLFNMLAIWMFGTQLESYWGTKAFTRYFFICGIGAALLTVLVSPGSYVTTIGASGAIFGLLLAFGLLFPNQVILFNFLIPIKAKYYVMIFGAMAFFATIEGTGGGVAHLTHLGGMLIGLIYLKGGQFLPDFRYRYDRWQRNRLRRKFDVYYNDRNRPTPPPPEEDRWRQWRN